MGTTLFIFDEAANPADTAWADGTGSVVLLPLTSDPEPSRKVAAALEARGARMETLPAARLVDAEVAAVRGSLARWSADLGRRLRISLAIPELGVSGWWFSLVSDRNTLKTDAFLRLAQLRAFRAVLASRPFDAAAVAVADGRLGRSLRAAASAAGVRLAVARSAERGAPGAWHWFLRGLAAWARLTWRGALARAAMGGRRPAAARLLFVTYFPALDEAELSRGRFRNRYAAGLQERLERAGRRPLWLLVFVPLGGKTFGSALALARRAAAAGEAVRFIEEFLSPLDALRGLMLWLRLARASRGAYANCVGAALAGEPWAGSAGEPLLRSLWRRSFLGAPAVEGILYGLAFRRVFAAQGETGDCVYLNEMQAWEKALNAAKRAVRPRWRTIGFQHGSLLGNFFNYFHDPSETSNADGAWPLPLPDVFAANGDLPKEALSGASYPGLTVVEALRYLYLAPRLASQETPTARRALLVAGSIDPREAAALAALVLAAFPRAEDFEIVFRGHPMTPFEDVFRRLGVDPAERGYELARCGVADSLERSAAVLAAGSGIAVEALAFGCEVLVPLFPDVMMMSPLADHPKRMRLVSGPEELRQALARVLAGDRLPSDGKAFAARYWRLDAGLPSWSKLLGLAA